MFSRCDRRGRTDNGRSELWFQQTQLEVGLRSSALDQTQAANEDVRQALVTEAKVIYRPLGLRAVQCVGGYLYIPETVFLDT